MSSFFITLSASVLVASISSAADDSLPLYQCYSKIRIQGDIERIDRALDQMMKIVTVANRLHSLTDGSDVRVEAMVSSIGVDRDETKQKVATPSIRSFLALTKQPLTKVEAIFLGCAEIPLKR